MTIDLLGFVLLALASYRATRFIVVDHLFEPMRARIWKKWPPSTKFGYLFTCYWCTGFWVALIFVILAFLLPDLTFVVSLVLSISALIGLISAFEER
jgi:hypothetical protein